MAQPAGPEPGFRLRKAALQLVLTLKPSCDVAKCERNTPLSFWLRAQYRVGQALIHVQFIWLNQQEAAATVARFTSLHGIPAVQTWLDAQGFMPKHTGQNGLPTTLFYDAAGQLQAVRNGELSAASLQHYLKQITR